MTETHAIDCDMGEDCTCGASEREAARMLRAAAEVAPALEDGQGPHDCTAPKCSVKGLCATCFENLGAAPGLRRRLRALRALAGAALEAVDAERLEALRAALEAFDAGTAAHTGQHGTGCPDCDEFRARVAHWRGLGYSLEEAARRAGR